MIFKLENLVPFEKIETDTEAVFQMVDVKDVVILIRNNQPRYIIQKYELGLVLPLKSRQVKSYTLHEAMIVVLSETPNHTMHAAKLSDEIFNRGLYSKRDGSQAQYNQIRARCEQEQYKGFFDTLPDNMIRLTEAGINQSKEIKDRIAAEVTDKE